MSSPRLESLASALHERPLPATAALCAVPYLALLGHVAARAGPSAAAITVLALVGGALPFVGLVVALSRVVRDRTRFRLMILLQTYAALVLIFATLYALLQVAGSTPAVRGMALWAGDLPTLHAILGDALYLSVITITTVGFGDLAPLSPLAKLLTALEGLAGIAFMGLALGHYFSVCTHCASPERADVEEHQP
ncbi:MAG: two pore domain potassium channel family protein [Myxococcales bacterium]|nr:two pore domain potassium channel family protein [Myxococcales bacterium]